MTPEQLAQLNELLEWKRKREAQQLSYPLDVASEDVLRARGFIIFADRSASTISEDKSIGINVNGVKYKINAL